MCDHLQEAKSEWPILEWYEVAERLAQQTFQVQRESCCGTAFLCGQGIETASTLRHFILATAWHVVENLAEDSEMTLFRRIDSTAICGKVENLMWARLGPPEFDLALLFLRTNEDILSPEKMMPVRGATSFPALGEELGWYGHPASLEMDPAFCRGSLACFRTDPVANHYLVNGAAYPGMSGCAVADQKGHVVGIVSQWWTDQALAYGQGMVQVAPSLMVRHVLEDRLGARAIKEIPPHS